MSVWISLEPLEPLLLRGHGEFDPAARGPISTARSLIWPRPTTVAGAIAARLYSGQEGRISSWVEDLRFMARILVDAGIEGIRGPLLNYEGRIFVPINDGKTLHIVALDRLPEIFEKFRLRKRKGERIEELLIGHSDRIGLHLTVREQGEKLAAEGYLYTAHYVAFPQGSSFLYEIVGEPDRVPEGAIKLGGEGRIARIGKTDFDFDWGSGSRALLLTPLPTERRIPQLSLGRIDVIGLGYSSRLRRRRPLVRAVMEGSVLNFEGPLQGNSLFRILDIPDEAGLETLGFGSFIKF